ncbi:MAG: hypothetical protein MK033_12585 [Candidatus Caenarcaniphilales bacterium]|nr:hypothetical protein [Candidatus Caenarcaniphilales bacterium]
MAFDCRALKFDTTVAEVNKTFISHPLWEDAAERVAKLGNQKNSSFTDNMQEDQFIAAIIDNDIVDFSGGQNQWLFNKYTEDLATKAERDNLWNNIQAEYTEIAEAENTESNETAENTDNNETATEVSDNQVTGQTSENSQLASLDQAELEKYFTDNNLELQNLLVLDAEGNPTADVRASEVRDGTDNKYLASLVKPAAAAAVDKLIQDGELEWNDNLSNLVTASLKTSSNEGFNGIITEVANQATGGDRAKAMELLTKTLNEDLGLTSMVIANDLGTGDKTTPNKGSLMDLTKAFNLLYGSDTELAKVAQVAMAEEMAAKDELLGDLAGIGEIEGSKYGLLPNSNLIGNIIRLKDGRVIAYYAKTNTDMETNELCKTRIC